ncbi:MAG: type II toxin-antitoxin system HicB family antitoxin [candidate division KSB1 bacterium]|nr:type II toxin-antitoxin system HicB family antitoxin [candidate division KSB1 bacterium]
MTPKYEIIPYWSNEDCVFVAEVPELPGCMAHGKTQEKALLNAKKAIRLRYRRQACQQAPCGNA